MISKNTTHLAGEFLVAGELSRRGYPVSITMGNAKSVDIYAEAKQGVFKIDAKAGRSKSNWPITKSSVKDDTYYIFVYLPTNATEPPQYFVVAGNEITSKRLITTWKTRQGITYSSLNTPIYREKWDKLPRCSG